MNRKSIGAIKVLMGVTLFSFGGLTSKWMPWDAITIVGVRSVGAVIAMLAVRRTARVALTRGNLIAAVCVALTCILFIVSNKITTAANAIVLQYAMPAIVIGLNCIKNRRCPAKRDLLTTLCVMGGVILCFAGNLGNGNLLGDILALLSSVTYAIVYWFAGRDDASPSEYSFLGNVFCCALCVNLFFDKSVTAQPQPWLVAALMGAMLGGGYLLLAAGMRETSPVQAAILSNVEPVLNPIWVFLVLGETPGMLSIMGALVVLTAVTVYTIDS